MKAYQILQFRQAKKNAHSSIFHRTTDEKKGLPMWWYLHFKLKRNHHRRSHIFLLLHKRQPKVLNFACSNTKKNVLTQPKRRGRREKNLGKLVIRISLQNAFCAVVASRFVRFFSFGSEIGVMPRFMLSGCSFTATPPHRRVEKLVLETRVQIYIELYVYVLHELSPFNVRSFCSSKCSPRMC